MSFEDRFWSKVNKTDTCWLWTASLNTGGYGQMRVGTGTGRAHRIAYQFSYGSIPDELVIDHRCGVTRCVRPSHLEAVTQKENVRRGRLTKDPNREYCAHGHFLSSDNVYVRPGGYIECRECRKIARSKNYNRRTK